MKAILFFLISTPSFAANVWQQATAAATIAYQQDYQAEKGTPGVDPVGYSLTRFEDEVLTRVYFLDGPILRAFEYGCHEHNPGEYDCHRENRAELGPYTRSSAKYSAEEMQNSVSFALELFVEKEAPEANITSIKIWEAEENIRFVIGFEKEGAKAAYLACHYHGSQMDCHRKRDSGPGEPEQK